MAKLKRRGIFRWRASLPLALFIVLVVVLWGLFADGLLKKEVESFGGEIVGARVDLDRADIQLTRGLLEFRGMQVTNPQRPMWNLFQADQILAAVDLVPLLEKKVIVDSVAIRGVRFGTARQTSGALERADPQTRRIAAQVDAWAASKAIPSFSLEGIGQVIDVSALRFDSLQTVAVARAVVERSRATRDTLEGDLRALNPSPALTSGRVLLDSLSRLDVRRLGVTGTQRTLAAAQSTVQMLGATRSRLTAFRGTLSERVRGLTAAADEMAEARRRDYARALGILRLPSVDTPDVSPSLFGDVALERVKPMLYWLNLAGEHLPPGLDPRRRPGPKRPRLAGTDVAFPRRQSYPQFLLAFAEATFAIAGSGAAAGDYVLRLTGLTSQPTVYGKPVEIVAAREQGGAGPQSIRVTATLDHTKTPVTDTIAATLRGVSLPGLALAPLNARFTPEATDVEINLRRSGPDVVGRWFMRANRVTWTPLQPLAGSANPRIGTRDWVNNLLWRVVSGLTQVEVEARFSGSLANPNLAIRSNLGQALAQSVRRELGEELRRVEQQVRAEVDRRVQEQVALAQQRVDSLRAEFQTRVDTQVAELQQLETELNGKLEELTRGMIRLPRVPRGV